MLLPYVLQIRGFVRGCSINDEVLASPNIEQDSSNLLISLHTQKLIFDRPKMKF